MFEQFTVCARKAMALANMEALRLNHECIDSGHNLLGLIKVGAGARALGNMGVDLERVRVEVERLLNSAPDVPVSGIGTRLWRRLVGVRKLPQMPRAKNVILYAIEEARSLNHKHVGTEHMLLALLRATDGAAAQVLASLGITDDKVRNELAKLPRDDQGKPEK